MSRVCPACNQTVPNERFARHVVAHVAAGERFYQDDKFYREASAEMLLKLAGDE